MPTPLEKLPQLLSTELALLWSAHHAAGLEGFMCLYSSDTQVPFRTKQPGFAFWFGPEDIDAAVKIILEHYNNGDLPNTPLLLNPIVHAKNTSGSYRPLGSGIIWCTALTLGVETFKNESAERLWQLGVHASTFHRGENTKVGIKVIGICQEAQPAKPDGKTVAGCHELFELTDIHSDAYAPFYLLSGLSYLTNNGLFQHPSVAELFPKNTLKDGTSCDKIVRDSTIAIQKIIDAAYCWDKYERHHSLYEKFGTNPDDVETNLRFFDMVAHDVKLFDATGPMRKDADEMFEFLVPGLIPRGSVTLLAGTGGSGKSSIAHQLCVMASVDYESGEEAPHWLGQRLAIEKCRGISVYFSGEDGPAIINARAAIFDPKGRATRLMFQRLDPTDGMTFTQHLRELQKIPEVPILVVDPARKYLTGDEDESGAVSEFFDALEEFAAQKNAAVVVVHHLQKGAHPTSPTEIVDLLRGSQVFVDRPRVIIGICRDGAYTIGGLAKNNIPPNFGMVAEERVFARDAQNLDLVWLPGHEGVRNANLSQEELHIIAEKAKKEGRA
jgi:AAA domain